jgi:hypothetical protein
VELTDRIISSLGTSRRRPGGPPGTDAELVCLALAQVLLRYDAERHLAARRGWPGRAPVFPGCWPKASATTG